MAKLIQSSHCEVICKFSHTGWFGHFQSQKPWLGVTCKMALVTENGATPSLVCIAYTGTGENLDAS